MSQSYGNIQSTIERRAALLSHKSLSLEVTQFGATSFSAAGLSHKSLGCNKQFGASEALMQQGYHTSHFDVTNRSGQQKLQRSRVITQVTWM